MFIKLPESKSNSSTFSFFRAVRLRAELVRLLAGLTISCGIGYMAWRRGSLSESGVAGAVLTGTISTGAGGYTHAAMLVGFFASSTILPKALRETGNTRFDAVIAKGGRRDFWQVLANGGVATVLALTGLAPTRTLGYLGALAAVNGDTWATEIGKTSPGLPRHVLTGHPIEPGTSGGVSMRGTLASVAGGAAIGAVAAMGSTIDGRFTGSRSILLLSGTVAGGFGSLVDSILGATVQERRWCPVCRAHTERTIHTCGTPTEHSGGFPGVTNDVINLACSLSGAAVGTLIGRIWTELDQSPAVE
jgi:uncharacterized protein (TIGR00297 family)